MMKSLIFCSVFLAGSVTLLYGQNKPTKQQIKDRDRNIFSVVAEPKHFNEVIDFEMINDAIIIPVKIHGNSYRFLFDSGALTLLSNELQETMHSASISKNDVAGSMGNSNTMNIYKLDSISLGNVLFRNVGETSTDMKTLSHGVCSDIDGIFGANIMRSCYWKIDYTQNKIYFSDQPFPELSDAHVLKFTENFSGSPLVNIKLGQYTMAAIWDSGNNRYIDLPDSAYFKSGQNSANTIEGNGNTIASSNGPKEFSLFVALADNIKIGDMELKNEPVRIIPGTMPLIGNLFMKRRGIVQFDWKKGEISIGNKSAEIDSSIAWTFGLTLDYVEGVCKVAFLWKGSQAEKDGIRLGDKITSINGTKTSGLSDIDWCLIRNSLQKPSQLTITIEHDGQPKDYTLSKYPFFSLK